LLSSYSVPTLWEDIEEVGHALIPTSCKGVPFSLLSSYSVPTPWEDIEEVGHTLISSSCKGVPFSLLSSYSVPTLWEDIEEAGHTLGPLVPAPPPIYLCNTANQTDREQEKV
jgi:hypothetical protein